MTFHDFHPNSALEIDQDDCRPQGHVPGHVLAHMITGRIFVAPDGKGVLFLPNDDQFDEMLRQERIMSQTASSVDLITPMSDLSRWVHDQAMKFDPAVAKMLAQINLLDAAGVKNGDKAIGRHLALYWTGAFVARFGQHDPVRTIRHWRAYRGKSGHRHAQQMIRRNRRLSSGPYAAEIPSEVIRKHVLAHWTRKPKLIDTYTAYVFEMTRINDGQHERYPAPETPFKIASMDTIRRRCRSFEYAMGDETIELRSHAAKAQGRPTGFTLRFRATTRPRYKPFAEHARGTGVGIIRGILPSRIVFRHEVTRPKHDPESEHW